MSYSGLKDMDDDPQNKRSKPGSQSGIRFVTFVGGMAMVSLIMYQRWLITESSSAASELRIVHNAEKFLNSALKRKEVADMYFAKSEEAVATEEKIEKEAEEFMRRHDMKGLQKLLKEGADKDAVASGAMKEADDFEQKSRSDEARANAEIKSELHRDDMRYDQREDKDVLTLLNQTLTKFELADAALKKRHKAAHERLERLKKESASMGGETVFEQEGGRQAGFGSMNTKRPSLEERSKQMMEEYNKKYAASQARDSNNMRGTRQSGMPSDNGMMGDNGMMSQQQQNNMNDDKTAAAIKTHEEELLDELEGILKDAEDAIQGMGSGVADDRAIVEALVYAAGQEEQINQELAHLEEAGRHHDYVVDLETIERIAKRADHLRRRRVSLEKKVKEIVHKKAQEKEKKKKQHPNKKQDGPMKSAANSKLKDKANALLASGKKMLANERDTMTPFSEAVQAFNQGADVDVFGMARSFKKKLMPTVEKAKALAAEYAKLKPLLVKAKMNSEIESLEKSAKEAMATHMAHMKKLDKILSQEKFYKSPMHQNHGPSDDEGPYNDEASQAMAESGGSHERPSGDERPWDDQDHAQVSRGRHPQRNEPDNFEGDGPPGRHPRRNEPNDFGGDGFDQGQGASPASKDGMVSMEDYKKLMQEKAKADAALNRERARNYGDAQSNMENEERRAEAEFRRENEERRQRGYDDNEERRQRGY